MSAAMMHGGAERVVLDLAVAGARQGSRVAIVAPPGSLDRDWAQLGVDRLFVPAAQRRPRDLARTAQAVRSALREWRPDVVHAHNVKSTALALAGARMTAAPRPVLSTMHGVSEAEMWTATQVLRFADMVAVVSVALRDAMVTRGLAAERVRVIHNGIAQFPGLDAGQRAIYDREFGLRGDVVAAVGRLAPQKAHDRLLTAAALVLESRPNATFLIVGDGELRADLERLAIELGIDSSVRFTGTREDARWLIERADLLVFSSKWEGLSIAALEALAAGTPVVATDVAGMRELLHTGAGRIVSGWDPRDLATAITALLDDPGCRRAMGEAGRRLVVEEFSASVMRRAYAELYDEVIVGAPARRRSQAREER